MNNLRSSLASAERPTIVVLGGGGGTSNLVGGFAEYADVTAIVATADSGGSTGALREQFGTLPVGDIRRVSSALSVDPVLADPKGLLQGRYAAGDSIATVEAQGQTLLHKIENLRSAGSAPLPYAKAIMQRTVRLAEEVAECGTLAGHNLGNLALTSLVLDTESLTTAASIWGEWIGARGRILPVTEESHTLVLNDDGEVIRGEHAIDEHTVQNPHTATAFLEGKPHITSQAAKAIEQADATVLAPGSVYTSLWATLGVEGATESLDTMQAHGGALIAIGNLIVGKDTQGMHAAQIVRRMSQKTGNRFTHLLANTHVEVLPKGLAIQPGVPEPTDEWRMVSGDFVGKRAVYDPNDALTRSEVEHNPAAVWRAVAGILSARQISLTGVSR